MSKTIIGIDPGKSGGIAVCLNGIILDFKKYPEILTEMIYQRYIGVIYKPQTELQSHYSKSIISKQYDSIIFINQTNELDYQV